MFGNNNQQNRGFGGNTGGGFGGSSAPSFGGGNATSGFGGGGGFGGGATSGFGGGNAFAQASQQPQNNPGGGLFGGQQNNQPNQGGGGLFGGQTQGMGQQSNTGFGGATQGFGQNPQTQGFGATTSAFSTGFGGASNTGGSFGGGGFGQNKPAGTGGLFGGPQQTQGAAISAFNQTSNQGAPQGGGLFGGQNNTAGGFGQQSSFNQVAGSLSQGQPGASNGIEFYSASQSYMQATTQTVYSNTDPQFQQRIIQQEGNDKKSMSLRFRNIRTDPKYELCSGPMLRLCDMRGTQQRQPQVNSEFTAAQQWQQQKGQYPLGQKLSSGPAQGGMNMGGQTGLGLAQKSTTLFGGQAQAQSTGLGGANSSFGFNQQQQQPQQNNQGGGLFGGASNNNQTQPSGGGLFGGGGQTTSAFGQNNTGFGANAGQSNAFGGGGLGLNKQPTQNQGGLFGGNTGTSAFGANPAPAPSQGGGLFGGMSQPQQNTGGGGLFGGQTQTQPSAGGGLFGGASAGGATSTAGGGLFGGQSAPAQPSTGGGGGLFGGAGAGAAQGGGGLFGGNTAQANPSSAGGGLFGGQNKPGGAFGGGAFGANPSSAAPSGAGATGGLFGTNPSQPQQNTGGLFGGVGANKPATGGGGLFGGAPQASNTGAGGLFGAKPAASTTGGGLFGGASSTPATASAAGGLGGLGGGQGGGLFGGGGAAAPSGGGGLFGAKPQPAQTGLGGGGLFGGQPSQPGGGGLFGSTPSGGGLGLQSQPTGLGLGANSAQLGMGAFNAVGVPQGQNPHQLGAAGNQLNLQNLYGMQNNDPLGLRQDQLLAESPHLNFQEEMKKINEEVEKGRLESNQQFEYQRESLWVGHADVGASYENYGRGGEFYRRPSQAEVEEERRQLERYEKEQERQYQANNRSNIAGRGYQTLKSTFSARDGFQTQRSGFRDTNPVGFRESEQKEPNFAMSRQASLATVSPLLSQKKDQFKSFTERSSQQIPKNVNADFSQEIKNVEAILPAHELGNQEEKVFKMSFHQTYNVDDAIKRLQKLIQNDMKINISHEKINFLHKCCILRDSEILSAIEPENANVTFKIFIDPSITSIYKTEFLKPKSPSPKSSQIDENRDWVPNYPREGHKSVPDYHDLVKMSRKELSYLKAFKIINEGLGEIEFLVPEGQNGIDVTFVDLQAFEIKHGMALGYDDFEGKFQKPEINTKLNIPAKVTLHLNKDVKEQKLLNIIQRQNKDDQCTVNGQSEHLYYHNREWAFKVPHWSKYGLGDSSDEEEGPEESKQIESHDISHLKAQKGEFQGSDSKMQAVDDLDQFKSQATSIQQSSLGFSKPPLIQQQKRPASPTTFRYGSKTYNEQFARKQNVFMQSSAAKDQRPLPCPVKEKIMPTKYSRNKKLFAKIAAEKKKREEFDLKLQQSELETKRTKVDRDLKKLVPTTNKDSQGNVFKNHSNFQVQRGGKPCFRPNGQLLTFHNINTFSNEDTPKIVSKAILHELKQPEGSKVDLTQTMLNNIKVQEVAHEPLKFERDLKYNTFMKSDNENNNQHTFFQSPYFQTLMAKSKIPLVQCDNGPKGIFNLMRDAGKEMVRQTKRPGHDFYVICLLNALFGDPRIHLIQMHPTYLTHNSSNHLDKAMKLYEKGEYKDIKESNECSKQRRNAVTELIRQICFIEYGEKLLHSQLNQNSNLFGSQNQPNQLSNDAQLYETAYQMLLNGQLKDAVKLLGKNGKNQLARTVALSVSTQDSTKSRIGLISNQFSSQGQSTGFQMILDLITSRNGNISNLPRSAKWHQILCSMLLYTEPSQLALSEVIKNFITLQQRLKFKVDEDGNEDVLLVLMKCYAGSGDLQYKATNQLNTFKLVKCQRFQTQWLVQHVLRLYSEYENLVYCDSEIDHKIGAITRESFNLTSVRYIDQLVKSKNYKSALIVCLMMQECNKMLKRKTMLEITGHACAEMFLLEKNNMSIADDLQKFYLGDLNLPPKFILVHVAMKNESNGNFVGAFAKWVEAQNYQKAHDILMTQIVPKSLGSRPTLLETQSFQTSNSKKPQTFKFAERKFIDDALEQLTENSSQIEHWGENGLLLKEILQLSQLDEQTAINRLLVLTKKVQSLGKSQLNCQEMIPLRQSLSEKLLKLEIGMKNVKQFDCQMTDCEANMLFDQTIQQMRNPDLINRQFVNNINFVSQNKY